MQRASTPAAFAAVFAENFNKLDAEALASTYPADAILNLGGGNTFTGPAQIVGALKNFQAARLPMTTTLVTALQTGDTAVVFFSWKIDGLGPDGAPVQMSGTAADVLRLCREPEGDAWRCILDHPFGGATAPAA